MSSIWMFRRVMWLYRLNIGHLYTLVFRLIRSFGVRYSDGYNITWIPETQFVQMYPHVPSHIRFSIRSLGCLRLFFPNEQAEASDGVMFYLDTSVCVSVCWTLFSQFFLGKNHSCQNLNSTCDRGVKTKYSGDPKSGRVRFSNGWKRSVKVPTIRKPDFWKA